MLNSIRKTRYDATNDILYILFDLAPTCSYGDDEADGVLIMRSIDTDEITGLTVFYPKRDLAVREHRLLEIGYPIKLKQYLN